MKKFLSYLFLLISVPFLAYGNKCTLIQIDSAVSKRIVETLNKENPKLWTDLKDEFYNRLSALKLLDSESDSSEALYQLTYHVINNGFYPEFYVDSSSIKTIELISSLEKIGFSKSDEAAHRFLYNIIYPIIKDCGYLNDEVERPIDLIIGFGLINPDTSKILYDITLFDIAEICSKNDYKRPGLNKLLILYHFSKMMKIEKY